MKTNTINQLMKNVILTAFATLSIFGCSKSNSDKTPVVSTAYTMSNGQCYNSSGQSVVLSLCQSGIYSYNSSGQCIMTTTGQQVTQTLCQQAANNGYTYNNGICIATATGQQVATTLCQQAVNNGYTYNNGICIATATGQQVPVTYCQQQSGGQQCFGTYRDVYGQTGQCNGQNCSGYTLFDSTGRQVYCQ